MGGKREKSPIERFADEVMDEDARDRAHDAEFRMSPHDPQAKARELGVPELIPDLIELVDKSGYGDKYAAYALGALGPVAKTAAPVLERRGFLYETYLVDEDYARERRLHLHPKAREQINYLVAKLDEAAGRAHFVELLSDAERELNAFALTKLEEHANYGRDFLVPLEQVRAFVDHSDKALSELAIEVLVHLHRPEDIRCGFLARDAGSPALSIVEWIAPLPESERFLASAEGHAAIMFVQRRRCAGLPVPANEPLDGMCYGYATSMLSLERGHQYFVDGELEDWLMGFAAYAAYAVVLHGSPKDWQAAFQIAWIDRGFGTPITAERIAWLRELGAHADLCAELAVPPTDVLAGSRSAHKKSPYKNARRAATAEASGLWGIAANYHQDAGEAARCRRLAEQHIARLR